MSTYSTYDDAILLELLKKGDETAFTEIYDRYWEKLLAAVLWLSGDQDRAKEIVQELFIWLWNKRDNIAVTHLESYLAKSVKLNFFRSIAREQRRREVEIRGSGKVSEADLEQEMQARFLDEFIRGKVEQLPEKCRLVYNYSRVQHMTNEQIAQKLNISEKTVEGHLTKSIRLLRKSVEGSGDLAIITFLIGEWLKHPL